MTLLAQLPALQVVVPLAAAPLALLLRNRHAAYGVVLIASWIALITAIVLWLQVSQGGPVSYALGSWPPPWGIEYRVDSLSAFILVLVSGMAALVMTYSRASLEAEVPENQHYLFYTMFALCLAGLLGITASGDAFNIFVFLEVSSLSTYVLIALGRDRRALTAAYSYLIMGTIGATFIVIGVGLLYLMTGTLNIADMAARLPAFPGSRPALSALAFLAVGISLKVALFPLHQWLPNAYTYSPSVVAAFLAATATKVSVYLLLRFYFEVFGQTAFFDRLPMSEVMLVLALAAMFAASTVAIFQASLKQLFAYSSVAQMGYIVLGMSFQSATGLTAMIVHMFNHAITKGAIFMLLGGVAMSMGGVTFARVQGLARVMPLTAAGLVICGLSLIGVPGTAGFVSKWYLVLAAVEAGQWWLVFLIVGSSLLAVVYVGRVVEAAYFRPLRADLAEAPEAPWSMLVPAGLLVAATVYFGLETSFTVGSASAAAEHLLELVR